MPKTKALLVSMEQQERGVETNSLTSVSVSPRQGSDLYMIREARCWSVRPFKRLRRMLQACCEVIHRRYSPSGHYTRRMKIGYEK